MQANNTIVPSTSRVYTFTIAVVCQPFFATSALSQHSCDRKCSDGGPSDPHLNTIKFIIVYLNGI